MWSELGDLCNGLNWGHNKKILLILAELIKYMGFETLLSQIWMKLNHRCTQFYGDKHSFKMYLYLITYTLVDINSSQLLIEQ